ncbi:MAG: hypothetical protein RIC04_14070 [Parvibaculum sp.]|uniref:hypothetical protein n=1 Tax=Parvibaculum sp. TaxID=2024848 RepID=UPI0032EB6608
MVVSTPLGVDPELNLGGKDSDLVQALQEANQQNANRAGQHILVHRPSPQNQRNARPLGTRY